MGEQTVRYYGFYSNVYHGKRKKNNIDEAEVTNIAKFIRSLNPDIPYKLLEFYPHFYMSNLQPTSKELAYSCLKAAKDCGLKNVDIGNRNLLI